jgi:hypothetical protein
MAVGTKATNAVMAAILRHWTTHALQQFREWYNLDDYEPDSLADLVERIEFRYRVAFTNPYWERHPKVLIVAKLTRRNFMVSPKVRLVYDWRAMVILTVLPLKDAAGRRCKLKTLQV